MRRVQQIAEGTARDKRVVIDYGRHEARLLELLERSEHARLDEVLSSDDRSDAFMCGRLEWFVEELHWVLLAGWGSSLTMDQRSSIVDLGVSVVADVRPHPTPEPGLLTLTRFRWLSSQALAIWIEGKRWMDRFVSAKWFRVPAYCFETGLVSDDRGQWTVAQAGEVLLKLRGKDVLQWLLTLEVQLATGLDDDWRVSGEWLAALRERGGLDIERPPSDEFQVRALEYAGRLSAMGVLSVSEDIDRVAGLDDAAFEWRLTDFGAIVLDGIARGTDTPLGLLARAIQDDEFMVAVESKASAVAPARMGVEATVRHARMVAHEVRNALGPVQHASRALRAALSDGTVGSDAYAQLDAIDQGITRLHRFVTDSVRLVPPESQRLAPFSVLDAIAEARKELTPDGVGSLAIETLPVSADPHGYGNRGQFVMAMLNVLRNAQQAAGHAVQISIRVDARDSQQLVLSIEDDGPGVPDAVREHIFENGVSYREDGTGHGLASLRAVVEDMGGKVRCTTSELGGAKFEIVLPVAEVSP